MRCPELLLSSLSSSLQLFEKQLELSELESPLLFLRLSGTALLAGAEPTTSPEDALGTGLLVGLSAVIAVVVADPGRFGVLPDGDGVGVELD